MSKRQVLNIVNLGVAGIFLILAIYFRVWFLIALCVIDFCLIIYNIAYRYRHGN